MIEDIKTEEVTFVDKILNVPYFSQYIDVKSSIENALRACGMTCVYMALSFLGKVGENSLDEMVLSGMSEGGFSKSGWRHDYFVDIFQKAGLSSCRKENMREKDVVDFVQSIDNGFPVVVSVERVLWDDRRFHMVLLTGFRKNNKGELEGFFYHDPGSLCPESASHKFVPISTFYLSWRKMAIFPQK